VPEGRVRTQERGCAYLVQRSVRRGPREAIRRCKNGGISGRWGRVRSVIGLVWMIKEGGSHGEKKAGDSKPYPQ